MGDGLGAASCELAHLGAKAYNAVGAAEKKTVIKLYLDVVEAFASIVVLLTVPRNDRLPDAMQMLSDAGFSEHEARAI